MADEADVLGRDGPQRQAPAWLRPLAIVVAVCVAAGWFVSTRDDRKAEPAPVASPSGAAGDDLRACGPANGDGLAWGSPLAAVQPDGRLVIWRLHLCNRSDRKIVVQSLRPLSKAERQLSADQVRELYDDGVAINASTEDVVPIQVPTGGQADARIVSVILGCDQPNAPSGLRAAVQVDGPAKQVDMPVRLPGVVPVESWCREHGPDAPSTVPVLRDGPVSVAARGSNIDIQVPLLNPNGVPISLTGLHSPSPGVRVAQASHVTLPTGLRATVSVRLSVVSCAQVFVDAPWQLTFQGSIDGQPAQLAPVRLAATDWQAAALRQICPATGTLATTTSQPEVKVSGPFARGAPANYQVTQVVRNVTTRSLVLHAHPRSAPGLDFVRAEVLPSAAAHAAIGKTNGTPLREWSLSPGSAAFLTFTYRLGEDVDPTCLAPPVDRWRAPVDATDPAGRPVTVADEATQAPQVPQAWVGGWRIVATDSCARPVRFGPVAPFVVVTGPAESAPDGKSMQYALSVYGVPGRDPVVLTGVRLVGAFAQLPVIATPALGEIRTEQRVGVSVSIPIHCPPPGVPVTLAVSYRGEAQPVLVELRATPTNTGQLC